MSSLSHTARRALVFAALLGSGACALTPAARVASGSAVAQDGPRATHRVRPGMEERLVEREVVDEEPEAPPRSTIPAREPVALAGADEALAPEAPREGAAKPSSPATAEPSAPTKPAAEKPRREAERARSKSAPSLPDDVRGLGKARCKAILDGYGVSYEAAEGASKEHLYVKPTGAIGGIHYVFEGRREVHEVMDCRLVVALLKWGPKLRAEGVRRIRHLSVYRPAARVARSGKPSGHASALAIDVRFVEFEDGRTLDVLEDWGNRRRGVAPCDEGVGAKDPNPELRRITCDVVDEGLFQTIITPHRDNLHENHVHLELVPEVDWTFIR